MGDIILSVINMYSIKINDIISCHTRVKKTVVTPVGMKL